MLLTQRLVHVDSALQARLEVAVGARVSNSASVHTVRGVHTRSELEVGGVDSN